MDTYVIGLDFGTESVRALLAEISTGEVLATSMEAYDSGVIDRALPHNSATLPAHWALQDPADWLDGLRSTIQSVLDDSGVPSSSVVGIGVDFTSSTVLPVLPDGTPLCFEDEYRDNPHAWPKLWKHHAAQGQAERINELAGRREEHWIRRYGGKLSSEWVLPKALQIYEEAPELYRATDKMVEGGDWITWQLTGRLIRNTCGAGYKACWHKKEGFPSVEFLEALDSSFADFYNTKFDGPIQAPGSPAGRLTPDWAERLGLDVKTRVAVAIIDAHSAAIGGGLDEPGAMFSIMGTSNCHLLLADEEISGEGIAGIVEDGIVPGYFGYETGQAAVGDIFAWFVRHHLPAGYRREAEEQGRSAHELLSEKAARLEPGESGLLALDWWNGNRSVLMDADLNGLLLGMNLGTKPEEIYRALIEATAFGTRIIIDAFRDNNIPIDSIIAGGGLSKNALLMQIYADVTGMEIEIAGSDQVSAFGAAILAAVAVDSDESGYKTIQEAVDAMVPPSTSAYKPKPGNREVYDELYSEYRRLHDYFGLEQPVMKTLNRLRRASTGEETAKRNNHADP